LKENDKLEYTPLNTLDGGSKDNKSFDPYSDDDDDSDIEIKIDNALLRESDLPHSSAFIPKTTEVQ